MRASERACSPNAQVDTGPRWAWLIGALWGVGICALCACLLAPLPNLALDLGIACSWALGVGFFTLALSAPPLSLSSLPQWLLLMAVGRLGLNIATTRAILSEARAGELVSAVGELVMGGSWLVGLSFFMTLTIVQLIVISRGAERIAEVSARFALEALPSAQQALTHALDRDAIHPEDARRARLTIRSRAELCGALDGAMRFVKGEALASTMLALVNMVGGVLVGTHHHGGSLEGAWGTYVPLMIGDGLVAQLPALLNTLAVATVVARLPQAYSSDREQGASASSTRHETLALGAALGALLTLSLTPGWPLQTRLAWGGLLLIALLFDRRRVSRRARHTQSVSPCILTLHPAALRAVGGEEALQRGLARSVELLGLPARPTSILTSRVTLVEGGYVLSRSGERLTEGVVVEGCYATFMSPPPSGELGVLHPLWGIEGWWRASEGGWGPESEPSALSQLDLLCAQCAVAWMGERGESWTLDEVWGRLAEAPESLRSATLKPWVEAMTLTALFRALSASGVDLRSSRALLEGVAVDAKLSSTEGLPDGLPDGATLSLDQLEERARRSLGWVRLSRASRRLSEGLQGDPLGGARLGPLRYIMIDLDCAQPWGEEEWERIFEVFRVACSTDPRWVVLCEPERRRALERRLRARASGVAVLSWAELPTELTLEQAGWVSA